VPREKMPSAHDIAEELIAEMTGSHNVYRPTTSPPWRRKVERWWLLATLTFVADHVLHELVRIWLLHRSP